MGVILLQLLIKSPMLANLRHIAKLRVVRGEALLGGVRKCQAKDHSIVSLLVPFDTPHTTHHFQNHIMDILYVICME